MPEISRFFGIIIAMFGDDHNPISKGIVKGQLPRKALKKVFEWMDEHHEELMANWARLQNGEEALPIDPLK